MALCGSTEATLQQYQSRKTFVPSTPATLSFLLLPTFTAETLQRERKNEPYLPTPLQVSETGWVVECGVRVKL